MTRNYPILILLIALASTPALAKPYSTHTLNRDIKVYIEYPLEAREGDWVTIRLELTALNNLTVNELWVTVVYHYSRGENILYDEKVLEDEFIEDGDTRQIKVRVCVEKLKCYCPDPYIELIIEVEYTPEDTGVTERLEYNTYLIAVRDILYDELLDDYNELKSEYNKLLEQVSELSDKATVLSRSLANVSGQIKVLRETLSQVREEKGMLEDKVASLEKQLEEKIGEYENLAGKYEELVSLNEELKKELEDVRNENVVLSQYKSKYELLTEEYSELKEKYSSLVNELSTYKVLTAVLVSALAVVAVALLYSLGVFSRLRLSREKKVRRRKWRPTAAS